MNSHQSPATGVRDLRNMPLSRANYLETRDTEFLENEENLIFFTFFLTGWSIKAA